MERELKSINNVAIEDFYLDIDSVKQFSGGMGKSITLCGPRLQLPVARLPWACGSVDTKMGKPRAVLTLSLDKENNNHGKLEDFMNDLDEAVLNEIVKHKDNIFKAGTDENKIRTNYFKSVKPPNDPKYSPTFQTKLSFQESSNGYEITTPACIIDTESTELKNIEISEALEKGAKVTAIVYPAMVWAMSGNKTSGVSWKTLGIKVSELGQSSSAMVFLPDPDED